MPNNIHGEKAESDRGCPRPDLSWMPATSSAHREVRNSALVLFLCESTCFSPLPAPCPSRMPSSYRPYQWPRFASAYFPDRKNSPIVLSPTFRRDLSAPFSEECICNSHSRWRTSRGCHSAQSCPLCPSATAPVRRGWSSLPESFPSPHFHPQRNTHLPNGSYSPGGIYAPPPQPTSLRPFPYPSRLTS